MSSYETWTRGGTGEGPLREWEVTDEARDYEARDELEYEDESEYEREQLEQELTYELMEVTT